MQEWFAKIDTHGIIAGLVGSLIALGMMPVMTVRRALTVLAAGTATAVYLVPLALFYIGVAPEGPPGRAVAFLGGLLGMKVILMFTRWADTVQSPADLLKPFRSGAGPPPSV